MSAMPVDRIVRFGINSRDLQRLAGFHTDAFGCRVECEDRVEGPRFERLMGVRGGAARVILSLGGQHIELLQFDEEGEPYPQEPSSTDIYFQHLAIVVRDMARAVAALSRVAGWTPITDGDPQTLPPNAGGVAAFKFRDPDGHPLEFLNFPREREEFRVWTTLPGDSEFLGIDHSAIGVSRLPETLGFYRALGFRETAKSLNAGREQERLDRVRSPHVDVLALCPAVATPHLELLHYRGVLGRTASLRSNDVAATRLILSQAAGDSYEIHAADSLLVDPDGHRMHLLGRPPSHS